MDLNSIVQSHRVVSIEKPAGDEIVEAACGSYFWAYAGIWNGPFSTKDEAIKARNVAFGIVENL